MRIPHRKRKVTTITLDPEIVEKAKKYNLNISRLSEDTLKETIRKLEHEAEPMGAPEIGKKRGDKEMVSKLPWAAAVIIIVAAGLGAWAIFGGAPTAPTEPATITGIAGPGTVFGAGIPPYSGIENVYIVASGQDYSENFSGLGTDNVLATLTDNDQTVNIPYLTDFAIVVAGKGHDENMAYVQVENMYVYINITGTFSGTDNTNITGNRTVFGDGTPTYIRVNHYFDNGGNYYQLPAGGSITLDPISYYTWE